MNYQLTLSQHVENCVIWMKREKMFTQATLDTWRPALRAYVQWLRDTNRDEPCLSEYNPESLRNYRDYLIEERENRPRSVKRANAALRCFGDYLIERGLLAENHAKTIKLPPMDAPIRNQVSDEEVLALLSATERVADPLKKNLARAYLSIFIYGALRRGECLALKITDINFDTGAVTIVKGKGGKGRVVYPATECLNHVRAWLAVRPKTSTRSLWAINKTQRMGEKTLYGIIDVLKAIAGFPERSNILPHAMRRNSAQFLLQHGATIDDVREHLGHSSIRTTEMYLGVSAHRLQQIREKGSRLSSPTPEPETAPPAPAPPAPSVPPAAPAPIPQQTPRSNAVWRKQRLDRGDQPK